MVAEAAWVERFERHLATERRLSAHTVSAYLREIAALRLWCRRTGVRDWKRIDGAQVRSFAARSHAAGLQPRSVQRRLSALRTFFGFLMREGLLAANPAVEVRAPKAGKRLPHTLDVDQMGALLALKPQGPLGVRDLAMMELLYSSGLRLAELVGLNLADLHLADRTVRVLGKGSKTRIMPVGTQALAALKLWLRERAALAAADETALFLNHRGRRLGGRAVQCWWRATRARRACQPACIRTCSGILLQLTCSNRAATCGPSRNCWATPASAPRRSTPTLISSISPAFTRVRIRAPAGAANRLLSGAAHEPEFRPALHDHPGGAP